MPNQDGTGPRGDGSRTGRGAGNCAGDSQPRFARLSPGRGFGQRRGGRRRRFRLRGAGMRGRGWSNTRPAADLLNDEQDAK